MSVIFSGKGTDLERTSFTNFVTVERIPVVRENSIRFSGVGTDLARTTYTIITEKTVPTTTIFLSCKGSDSSRLGYTKTFSPNPTRVQGRTGIVDEFYFWTGGLGDISGDLGTYTNRDGINPSGGTGVL